MILVAVSVLGLANDGVLDLNLHPAFFAGIAAGLVFSFILIAALVTFAKKQQKAIEED